MIDAFEKMDGGAPIEHTYLRTRWKRPVGLLLTYDKGQSCVIVLPKLHFEAKELANIMYDVYLRMFPNEDNEYLPANRGSPQIMQNMAFVWYHVWYQRAGFAYVVRLFETRVDGDWEEAVTALLELVINRPNSPLTPVFYLELTVYRHISGTDSDQSFLDWHHREDPTTKGYITQNQCFPGVSLYRGCRQSGNQFRVGAIPRVHVSGPFAKRRPSQLEYNLP